MKIKLILGVFAAATLLWSATAIAQTATNDATATHDAKAEFKVLFAKTISDIKAGKKTEADLSDDLKQFDALLAEHKGEQTDAVANILYMKAMLYAQVIGNTDKSDALMTQLKTEFKDTPLVTKIEKNEEEGAAAKKIQDALVAGAVFPDFAVTGLDSQPLSVGALKGKVVLVDFWATWCGPCRAELPNVIATYKKHHADGFDIIGVSLDSERDKLDSFLKQEDGMTWPQFFDGKGWQNELAGKYGVRSIPFAILVGPDGKIIAKNLRGQELENAVAAALVKI